MSAFVDVLFRLTDPASVLLLGLIWREVRANRRRVNRLESSQIEGPVRE